MNLQKLHSFQLSIFNVSIKSTNITINMMQKTLSYDAENIKLLNNYHYVVVS